MKRACIQRGFSLVSAIFLLVVLAVLGAGMVTFSTVQNQNLAMDTMGSRAYQAANTGIEWAAYNIASSPGVGGGITFNPAEPSLAPFTVTVGYNATSSPAAVEEGADVDAVNNRVWSYNITSTATLGVPGVNYVERVIVAKR